MPTDKLPALPPRPQVKLYPRHDSGNLAYFPVVETKEYMDAQDACIASLLRYSELCPEHLSNAVRGHMPAAEGKCASCLLTRATSMRFKAEAKVAELEREIREARGLLVSNAVRGPLWFEERDLWIRRNAEREQGS